MPISPLILTRQMFGRPEFTSQSPHQEKGKLGSRLRKHVRGICKRNFIFVGVGAVDIVESNGELRHNSECALSGRKNLGIDGIAQSSNQSVNARLHLFDDQTLRRRFGLGIDLKVVTFFAKNVKGVANIAGRKNADSLAHSLSSVSRIA